MSSSQFASFPDSGELRDVSTRIFRHHPHQTVQGEIPADLDREDLVSLLRTEIRHFWSNGEAIRIEHFRPQLERAGATCDDWLTLIAVEIQLRRERGQFPEVDEYLRRFPALASRLPAIHQAAVCPDNEAKTQIESGSKRESIFDGSYSGKSVRQPVGPPELEIDDLDLHIPGYEIRSILGRGGMGVVYEACQLGLNRMVALKMILSGSHADKEDRARFLQEAEAVAALRHPNIVQVYEIGEHEGKPFFSMEYVEGGTLAQRIKGQPQSLAFTVQIAEHLALAVQSAHEQNIIHRDLKPANILLTLSGGQFAAGSGQRPVGSDRSKRRRWTKDRRQKTEDRRKSIDEPRPASEERRLRSDDRRKKADDRRQNPDDTGLNCDPDRLPTPNCPLLPVSGTMPIPKITDFGLAKRLDSDMQLTTSGLVAGTPQYMAPEQVSAARQAQVGPAADVWSLGVILYEMLTGRPPFLGSNPAEIMHQVLRQEPVAIRQLQPNVPRDLETICLRCLQKEPPKRYPSAQALAADLQRFRLGEPILARPVGTLEQVWRWRRRNPAIAALTGLIALTLICGALVASFFALSAREQARRAEHHAGEAERLGEKNRLTAEELLEEKQTVLEAHRKLSETHRELTTSHEAVKEGRKEEVRLKKEAEQREKLRARELYDAQMTLAQRAWDIGQVPRTRRLLADYEPLHHDREDLRGFEWFYLDRISNADGMRFTIPEGCRSVALSPDGTRIIWAFKTVCEVWQLKSPPTRLFVLGANAADRHQGIVERVACDPTGKYMATASHDRTIKIWEAETGKLVQTLSTGADWAVALRFSPNGKQLAASTSNPQFSWQRGEVRVWDLATWEQKHSIAGHEGSIYDVAWSPDGDYLATAGHDQCVKIWDANSGKPLRTLPLSHGASARSVAFAPRGPLLAAGTSRGDVVVWNRDDWKEQRILRGHVNWVHAVAFWSDGRSLASAGSDMLLKIWDAGTGQEIRTYRGHSSRVVDAVWHPLQPFVFSASLDQSIRGWNTTDDPEQFAIRSLSGNLAGFHLLPDGRHIVVAGQKAFLGIWDATQARTIRSINARNVPLGTVWSSCLSPDGSTLVYTRCPENDDAQGAVFFWSFAHQEPRDLKLPCLYPGVRGVALSRDGKRLATGHRDGMVQFHDLSGVAPPRTWQAHPSAVHQVLFTPGPQGSLLTVAGDTPRLWNPHAGAEIARLAGHDRTVRCAAFSNDGRLIATASDDQTARLWDAASGKLLQTLEGHIAPVTCVAFSPKADRLVTGSDDFTLKLWDLKTGHETLTLRGHTLGLTQVAFAPDGRRILSTAQDETVRVWHAGPVTDRELLRAAAAACRLTSFSVDGKRQVGQELMAHFELANVSGKEWPAPPSRKTTVPYRTVLRAWAEPITNGVNESRQHQGIGRFEFLPTTRIATDYKYADRFPISLGKLEAGKYRLRIEHGWQGDDFVLISEKEMDIELAPDPNRAPMKKPAQSP